MMQGLLDFVKTPEGQGLLAAGFGAAAGARPGQPWNTLGRGGMAGLMGYANAQDQQAQEAQRLEMGKDREQNRAMRQMQIDMQTSQLAKQKGEEQWRAGLPAVMQQATQTTYGAGDEGPTMTKPNPAALRDYTMLPNSPFADEVMKAQLFPKADDYKVVGGSLVQVGQGGVKPVYTAPEKPEAAPSSVREYQFAQGQGYGGSYEQFQRDMKKAGANNVNVTTRVENKASESVAGQVGPILEKSLVSAEGAMRVLDASDRVIKAMDSGKVITGPLANVRVTGLQIGQMLGVGGKDDAEVLANTRQAIRGLSEMTLQGRKEMSGQGAITDRESALAEKATSGDIGNLTAEEVKILANASARASRYQITKHQGRVKNAGALPGMGNITPFFDVPPMAPEKTTQPASNAVPTMRYNPATKKVEQVR